MNLRTGHNLKIKSELTRFWRRCNRRDYTEQYRLTRLKEFAGVVISETTIGARRFKREQFVHGYCRRGSVCFACPKPARIRHHIIQLQNGGNNTKENIVPLCLDCHAEIHPWMKKPRQKEEVAPSNPPVDNLMTNVQEPEKCEQLSKLSQAAQFSWEDIPLADYEVTRELVGVQVGDDLICTESLLKERVDNSLGLA